ncbi:hypothetical protein K2X96_01710 [Patescibacteria group bacterium]|nr:hypothetical protein [Patescibacteria group bacterium]
MVQVMTNRMESRAYESTLAAFDVSTPQSRARLLAELKKHSGEFTKEESAAYNTLRDTLLDIARGQTPVSNLKSLQEKLGHFLDSSLTAPTTPRFEPEVAAVLEKNAATPVLESEVSAAMKRNTVNTTSMMRPRRGPDVRIVLKPEPAPKKVIEASVFENAPQVMSAEVEKETEKSAVVSEMPRVKEVVDEPVVVPSYASVPTPAVSEVVAPEPVIAEEKSTEPTSPSVTQIEVDAKNSQTESEEDIVGLRSRIESINESLNEFAQGSAFRWLSDASTGYRAYLDELLNLRSDLSSPDSSSKDITLLRERVTTLEAMADAVRVKVGGGAVQDPENKADSDSALNTELNPNVTESAIENNTTPAPSSPAESNVLETPVAVDTVEPAVEQSQVATGSVYSQEDSPEGSHLPPLQKSGWKEVSQTPEDTASGTEELSGTIVSEAPVSPSQEATPSVPQQPTPAESVEVNPLATPAVETGLNDLLMRWLGTTGMFGFIGLGKSGTNHPDWLKMKDLTVEETLHSEGVVPPGLKLELFNNLGQNIIAWRDAYQLYPGPDETVDHFLRRVVVASMPK